MESDQAVFTQLLLAGVWPPVTTGWERLSLTLCDSCDEPLTYMVLSVLFMDEEPEAQRSFITIL